MSAEFCQTPPNCLPDIVSFHIPPAMDEGSCDPTSSPAFGVVLVSDFSLSESCPVMFHGGVNLQFANVQINM